VILISTRLVRNPSSNSPPRHQTPPPVLMMMKSSQSPYQLQDLLWILYKGALINLVLHRWMTAHLSVISQESLPLNWNTTR